MSQKAAFLHVPASRFLASFHDGMSLSPSRLGLVFITMIEKQTRTPPLSLRGECRRPGILTLTGNTRWYKQYGKLRKSLKLNKCPPLLPDHFTARIFFPEAQVVAHRKLHITTRWNFTNEAGTWERCKHSSVSEQTGKIWREHDLVLNNKLSIHDNAWAQFK